MKRFSQMVSILLGLSVAGSAIASLPYYGLPKHESQKSMPNDSNVVVDNHTFDFYTIYATYQCFAPYQCSQPTNFPLYPQNDPRKMITYPVNYPDYQVCLNV